MVGLAGGRGEEGDGETDLAAVDEDAVAVHVVDDAHRSTPKAGGGR